ncbi:MAG: hypothetical protein ABOJ95_000826 [Wolbachia endosymbiont of Armadillidium vulgare]|uniref:hypothetical protein n=1 Tax=Wolbachia endosymbiont of Armadillidium vulgare TaxID=77039 RepID=UPI00064B4D93|nr:hypothetical protein [Wolbachia endosymbiont of Armadillidium vulgare]
MLSQYRKIAKCSFGKLRLEREQMFLTGKLYVLPLLTVNDMTLGFLKSRCYQVLADAGFTAIKLRESDGLYCKIR